MGRAGRAAGGADRAGLLRGDSVRCARPLAREFLAGLVVAHTDAALWLRCAPEESLAYATAQAKLAAGPALRRNYMAIKHKAKGQVARMVMVNHRPPSNGGSRSKHC